VRGHGGMELREILEPAALVHRSVAEPDPVDVDQDPDYVDPRGTIYIVSGAGGKTKKNRPTRSCGPTAFFRDETLLWTQVSIDGPTCTIRTWESQTGKPVDAVVIRKTRLP